VVLSADSSTSVYAIPGRQPAASRTSLDGEVAKCQQQLADLVTCPSSKTPEGKAAMQALSEKLAAARAAINNTSSPAANIHAPAAQDAHLVDIWA
jgi:small-conductance mechanosensitive channel